MIKNRWIKGKEWLCDLIYRESPKLHPLVTNPPPFISIKREPRLDFCLHLKYNLIFLLVCFKSLLAVWDFMSFLEKDANIQLRPWPPVAHCSYFLSENIQVYLFVTTEGWALPGFCLYFQVHLGCRKTSSELELTVRCPRIFWPQHATVNHSMLALDHLLLLLWHNTGGWITKKRHLFSSHLGRL